MLISRVKVLQAASESGSCVATLARARYASRGLVVVAPGFGYGCDGPLLRYPAMFALGRGIAVLRVEYSFVGATVNVGGQAGRFVAEATHAALTELGGEVPRYWLAKSLGCSAQARHFRECPPSRGDEICWISPGLKHDGSSLRAAIDGCAAMVRLVVGEEDEQFAGRAAADSPGRLVDVRIVPGADHGIEDLRDIRRTFAMGLDTCEFICEKIGTWHDRMERTNGGEDDDGSVLE